MSTTASAQARRTQAIRAALHEHGRVVWSNRLDARMQALGVSTQRLADSVGVPYQTVWKLRRGDIYPREYLRIALAMALGAEVSDLFPMPDRAKLLEAVA